MAAAADLDEEVKEPEAKSASAPARAPEALPAGKPAAAKGKGSAIASMWSKAPAKKAKKAVPQQAAAQPSLKQKAGAVDSEAFMRLNQQVRPMSGSANQQLKCMHRPEMNRHTRALKSEMLTDEAAHLCTSLFRCVGGDVHKLLQGYAT